jgi:diguanylate cyclase (GGDEF)-like protein/PAS domain S-box-containing protein
MLAVVPLLTAVLLLVAALVGEVPPLLALALATALGTTVPAVRLIRLAVAMHARDRSWEACRGAGLLGLAALLGAAFTAGLPLVQPAERAYVALVGLAVVAVVNVVGLLFLPGTAPTVAARMRRAIDGVSLAISLFFAAWVVLLSPAGGVRPVALAAALVASSALAVTALTAVRASQYRSAALWCGAGVGLGVVALAIVVDAMTGGADAVALPVAGVAWVMAPALTWIGASRADQTPAARGAADLNGTFTSYPLLSIPVAVAAVAAVYHVVTVGDLDATSLGLGAAVGVALAIREALATLDVRRYAERLVAQEAHFRSLVAGSSDVTVVIGPDLVVRWQSPAAARQFGLSDQDVLGRRVTDLVHPEDSVRLAQRLRDVLAGDPTDPPRPVLVEARLRDGFGRWRDTESTVSDQRATPEVNALVVHVRDVGERKHLERTLHRLAFTDQLTGLPNRRELLRAVAALRSVPGRIGAVLVFDLDGVTGINDVRGREVGDAVLVEVARRLRAGIGFDDVAARLGGDEFAVLTPEGSIEAYGLGMRLLTMLAEPYELPGTTVHLSASVGLAEVTPRDGVDEIVYRADLACRRARQLGRNRVEWYDESLETLLLRRSTLEQSLPGAAGRGELDVVFQPIVDLLDRRPLGLEALLRWRHPTLGTILPGELVPVAEQLGVICEVGAWVVRAVTRQLGDWLREGRDLWVSVNVSRHELAAPGFLAAVTSGLNNYQVPPERLTVEIAESGVGADLAGVVTQLARLRALGIRTALDHFGAGQTSLAYLRRLPVDILKIDSTLFLEPAARTGDPLAPSSSLIDVVVGLGRRLGLEIVAEGLEVEAHLDLVRNAGCRYGQGFLFGRPQPVEHIEAYLESRPTR